MASIVSVLCAAAACKRDWPLGQAWLGCGYMRADRTVCSRQRGDRAAIGSCTCTCSRFLLFLRTTRCIVVSQRGRTPATDVVTTDKPTLAGRSCNLSGDIVVIRARQTVAQLLETALCDVTEDSPVISRCKLLHSARLVLTYLTTGILSCGVIVRCTSLLRCVN